MKGYAKIKESYPFSLGSKSKENPFLDQDLDGHLDIYSSNLPTKNYQENDIEHHELKEDLEKGGEEKMGGALRRNVSVSSSKTSLTYQKNVKSCNLERQSSTRVIQETVKRAFSMRRSSSVNSDRYCRIYDQPISVDNTHDYVCDYGNDGTFNHDDDNDNDEFERSGSMETRSMGLKKKNKDDCNSKNGKMHVGSKVVKACKRLFSR